MGMKDYPTRVRTEFQPTDQVLVFKGSIDGGPIKPKDVVMNCRVGDLPLLRRSKKFNVRIIEGGEHFIECRGRTDAVGDLHIEETSRVK